MSAIVSWLVFPTLGLLFNTGLYWLFKNYGVSWICKKFLNDSVYVHESPQEGEKRKHVSKGAVASASAELVGCVVPGLNGVIGVLVMMETGYDPVNAKSAILITWCNFGIWYFVSDTYHIYDVYCLKKDIFHLPLSQRVVRSVRAKWLYIFHHIFSFLFGYLIVVNTGFRNGKIDFYFAAIMVEELCNPLICLAKIFKVLGQSDSPYYAINGVSLAVTYFIFRVLNQPLVMLAYVAQYHQWDFLRAAASLRLVCYFTLVTQYSFQVYWFSAILRLVITGIKEKYFTTKNKTQ